PSCSSNIRGDVGPQLSLEHEELTPQQKDTVSDLSLSWDLPAVNKTNRRWLHNKLLLHALNNTSGFVNLPFDNIL
uniref:Uncharacterized protein n=1 Tax=Amphiprion ocellaris TaxID=80972 RepID=A0AAQ5YBB2_AMPOC